MPHRIKECELCHKHRKFSAFRPTPSGHMICYWCSRKSGSFSAFKRMDVEMRKIRKEKALLAQEEHLLYLLHSKKLSESEYKARLKLLRENIYSSHKKAIEAHKATQPSFSESFRALKHNRSRGGQQQ